MNKFAEWFNSATAQEKEKLSAIAKISVAMVYKIVNGQRRASAEVAGRMEEALSSLDRPPGITRADICQACAECPYALKCLKGK